MISSLFLALDALFILHSTKVKSREKRNWRKMLGLEAVEHISVDIVVVDGAHSRVIDFCLMRSALAATVFSLQRLFRYYLSSFSSRAVYASLGGWIQLNVHTLDHRTAAIETSSKAQFGGEKKSRLPEQRNESASRSSDIFNDACIIIAAAVSSETLSRRKSCVHRSADDCRNILKYCRI